MIFCGLGWYNHTKCLVFSSFPPSLPHHHEQPQIRYHLHTLNLKWTLMNCRGHSSQCSGGYGGLSPGRSISVHDMISKIKNGALLYNRVILWILPTFWWEKPRDMLTYHVTREQVICWLHDVPKIPLIAYIAPGHAQLPRVIGSTHTKLKRSQSKALSVRYAFLLCQVTDLQFWNLHIFNFFFCTVCRDTSSKCAMLALLDKCISGDKRVLMLTHCRQSCGLCQGKTFSCLLNLL